MPRPRKWRRVCAEPKSKYFGPLDIKSEEIIIMTVEEYESIRLIDYENLTQEECAKSMEVARTTIQRIYNSARNKISRAFVENKSLTIDGGDYMICEENASHCGRGKCRRLGRKKDL